MKKKRNMKKAILSTLLCSTVDKGVEKVTYTYNMDGKNPLNSKLFLFCQI